MPNAQRNRILAGMYSDRESLLNLATALHVTLTQLARDECGNWLILGRRGHIYVDGDGYLIVVQPAAHEPGPKPRRRCPSAG